MTKRNRSEFERSILPSDDVQTDNAATSEVALAAVEGSLKDPPTPDSLSPQQSKAQTSAEVSADSVASTGGSTDYVADANWALEEEFGASPLWALLARAGYTPWDRLGLDCWGGSGVERNGMQGGGPKGS